MVYRPAFAAALRASFNLRVHLRSCRQSGAGTASILCSPCLRFTACLSRKLLRESLLTHVTQPATRFKLPITNQPTESALRLSGPSDSLLDPPVTSGSREASPHQKASGSLLSPGVKAHSVYREAGPRTWAVHSEQPDKIWGARAPAWEGVGEARTPSSTTKQGKSALLDVSGGEQGPAHNRFLLETKWDAQGPACNQHAGSPSALPRSMAVVQLSSF